MPGSLDHSPAEIVRRVLIALGLGADPQAVSPEWPVYAVSETNNPDNVITVYNTTGTQSGRTRDGERQEHHGIQIRVRSAYEAIGYQKARDIAVALDQDVYQEPVAIDGKAYRVHAITRTSDVLSLGRQTPNTERRLFTVNAVVSLRQTA